MILKTKTKKFFKYKSKLITMFSLNRFNLLSNLARCFQNTHSISLNRSLSKAQFNYLDPLKLQNQLSEDENEIQTKVRNYASTHLLPKGKLFFALSA